MLTGSRAGRTWGWSGCGPPPCLPHQRVSRVQGTEMGGAVEPAREACLPAINHRTRLCNYLGT